MATRHLELHFPLGGVTRVEGFHEVATRPREIYTTPWAVNCRPRDVFERRMRGGSRPGIGSGGLAVPAPPVTVSHNAATVYNAATGKYSLVTATAGAMPTAFSLGTVYRARLLLAGGNAIYASRQGDIADWNYGEAAGDAGRATMLQLSEAGEYGQTVTAMIPHKDVALLAATAGSLWHLAGDPVTGRLRNLSRDTGIIGANAWTKAGDTILFMAADGLHSVSAAGSDPQNLSAGKVPNELRNLTGQDVLLAYNDDEKGVYVFVQGATYQWFFDLLHGGFWPMTLATVPNQAAVVAGVLRLGRNGSPMTVGTSESITSNVLLGPIRLASPGTFGRVLNLCGAMGQGSGSVAWKLIAGNTAEEAAANGKAAIAGNTSYVVASGTLVAGQSHLEYPRIRAAWVVVWLSASAPWAYESVAMEITQSGKWR